MGWVLAGEVGLPRNARTGAKALRRVGWEIGRNKGSHEEMDDGGGRCLARDGRRFGVVKVGMLGAALLLAATRCSQRYCDDQFDFPFPLELQGWLFSRSF